MITSKASEIVNGFDFSNLDNVNEEDKSLLERRLKVLGPIYPLFYEHPVHVVSAEGCRIYDSQGREYLDVYNNVPSVGHSNPHVRECVNRQLGKMNTHTRYLQDGVVDYSERLLATFPEHIGRVIYTNSGSEANDLAIRLSRALTGNQGVIITSNAYHGTTALLSGMSPSVGKEPPLDPAVRIVDPPDSYRVGANNVAEWFKEQVLAAIEDLSWHGYGTAAILIDTIMSSDGIFSDPKGMLVPAFEAVHQAGGFCIADEVQPGAGRTGEGMWGFTRHTDNVDIVTCGKPLANGMPIGLLALRTELSDDFSKTTQYFNTFGGNPATIAAAGAVLDEIENKHLIEHASTVGDYLQQRLQGTRTGREYIGDVRGTGLFIGIDIVSDGESKTPDGERAKRIVNGLRDRRVLISAVAKAGNVLKVRPPLPFDKDDVDAFMGAFEDVLNKEID